MGSLRLSHRLIGLVCLILARPVLLEGRVTIDGPVDGAVLLHTLTLVQILIDLLLFDHVVDLAHVLLN